jgi:hypothetical protein
MVSPVDYTAHSAHREETGKKQNQQKCHYYDPLSAA